MRDRFPLLLLAGLLLVSAVGYFLIQSGQRAGFADRLSTFKSGPDGARGLYLLLSESALPVSRQVQDLTLLKPGLHLALLGTSFSHATSSSTDAGVDEADFAERGLNALRSPPVSDDEEEQLLKHVQDGATLIVVPNRNRLPHLLDKVGITWDASAPSFQTRTLVPGQPSRYVRGVQQVATPIDGFLVLPAGALALLIDDALDKPVAGLVSYGQGHLVVIASQELAMNRHLAVADNAQFWHSLFSAVATTGTIAFDEFHHGFTGERSLGEFAGRYGLHFALGQLLIGVALWALALRRFGQPRVPQSELRLGATDALFATSRLYREGQHRAHAAQSIVTHLTATMASKLGLSTRATQAELVLALEARGHGEWAQTLTDLQRAAPAAATDADIEHVATRAALLRQKLTSPAVKKAP